MIPALLLVVDEGKTKPPVVADVAEAVVDPPIMIGPTPVVTEPVAVPPMDPVHEAPEGQQATCLAESAEQMAEVGQQVFGAPRLEQGL